MKTFSHYLRSEEKAGANISWGSVVAGVVTFIAIFITLSLIGAAIGFGMLQPTSNDPINGAGTGVIVWTIIAFFLSFAAGGFVAGLTSGRVGLVHGFLTWATATLALVVLISHTAIAALSGIGSFLGTAVDVAGKGVSSVASGAGDAISEGVKELTSKVDVDVDQLQSESKKYLADTGVKELQPEYLSSQLDEVKNELTEAAKSIVTEPDKAQEVINKVGENLKQRAEKIGANIDKDAIANAVSKNSELNREEAKKAAENLHAKYQQAVEQTKKAVAETSKKLEELKQKAKETIASVRQTAEDATSATSSASIWAFVGLVLAMISASGFGILGARVGSKPQVKAQA